MEKKKLNRIIEIMGIIVIILTWCYFFVIQYYQLRMGDDVLAPYLNSTQHYITDGQWVPTTKIANVHMMLSSVLDYWLHFGGRITTVFWWPLLGIAGGEFFCSVVGACVYTGIILTIGKIAWKGRWRDILSHPCGLIGISLYQYIITATSSYMQMWTFVCHYAMPTLLCLVYYLYSNKVMEQEHISKKNIVGLILLGILVGASHEVTAILCMVLVGTRGLVLLFKKKMFWKRLTIYIGLLGGACICIFAPGNFARMKIAHDTARVSTSILVKIKTSLEAHILAAGLLAKWALLLLGICFIGMLFSLLFVEKKRILDLLIDNAEFLMVILCSVIVWAVFAPPVPQYGLQLMKACICIFIFRNIKLPRKPSKIYLIVTCMATIGVLATNVPWCKDLISITSIRREQIQEAKEAGKEEVEVAKYPDSTAKFVTFFNLANEDIYSDNAAQVYYGLRIYVKK